MSELTVDDAPRNIVDLFFKHNSVYNKVIVKTNDPGLFRGLPKLAQIRVLEIHTTNAQVVGAALACSPETLCDVHALNLYVPQNLSFDDDKVLPLDLIKRLINLRWIRLKTACASLLNRICDSELRSINYLTVYDRVADCRVFENLYKLPQLSQIHAHPSLKREAHLDPFLRCGKIQTIAMEDAIVGVSGKPVTFPSQATVDVQCPMEGFSTEFVNSAKDVVRSMVVTKFYDAAAARVRVHRPAGLRFETKHCTIRFNVDEGAGKDRRLARLREACKTISFARNRDVSLVSVQDVATPEMFASIGRVKLKTLRIHTIHYPDLLRLVGGYVQCDRLILWTRELDYDKTEYTQRQLWPLYLASADVELNHRSVSSLIRRTLVTLYKERTQARGLLSRFCGNETWLLGNIINYLFPG